ncbi:MAG TPA: hypothetical protein VNS79_03720 [Sphingobium sp.]|nr:hypothetical protein [Sphingobium sp.]
MPVATMEDVCSSLEPYHDTIREIVHGAWAEWRAVDAFRQTNDYGSIAFKRTISNYVFDAIARRAVRAFSAHARVHIRSEAQTVKFFAGGDVLFRFKKGDDMMLGRNIPTEAALAFIDADGVVPGLPPETAKVEIIWLPNEIWTEIDRVLVIARDGDRLIWEYDLGAAKGGAEVILLPTPTPPEPTDDNDMPLVKPKPVGKPKTGEEAK